MSGQAVPNPAGDSGVFSSPPARWARLKYGGANRPWHILRDGVLSICGRQSFDYPRREFSIARPLTGKLCGHCLKTEARL